MPMDLYFFVPCEKCLVPTSRYVSATKRVGLGGAPNQHESVR
jgi:hypothetical protein